MQKMQEIQLASKEENDCCSLSAVHPRLFVCKKYSGSNPKKIRKTKKKKKTNPEEIQNKSERNPKRMTVAQCQLCSVQPGSFFARNSFHSQ